MKYYCFVQARYSSKRLKGKVLKKFGNYTLLEILLKRLKKSRQINKIIVLTSTSQYDKKIVNLCKKKKILLVSDRNFHYIPLVWVWGTPFGCSTWSE